MSDDIVREFLVECNENLDLLDRELAQLKENPTNREVLSSVFRTIRTIKLCAYQVSQTNVSAHISRSALAL